MYLHQKHILEQLTQDEDTKRVRQIRASEQAESVYDFVTGPTTRYLVQRNRSGEMRTIAHDEMHEDTPSPYAMYNVTDEAEDEVLFDGGRDKGLFQPVANPMAIIENSRLTQTMIRYGASLIDGADMDDTDEDDFEDNVGKKQALLAAGDDSDAQHFIHSVPPIWRHAYFEINRNFGKHGKEREDMLERLDFFAQKLEMSGHELQHLSSLELMERDRSYGKLQHFPWARTPIFCHGTLRLTGIFHTAFKESFHMGDLEPGAREKYIESMKMIIGAQNFSSAKTASTAWAWYCLDILDLLELRAWYDDYDQNPLSPWPHRYLAQDVTQAFVTMSLFFPNVQVTKLVVEYLDSEEGSQFQTSEILDPCARSRKLPDRRSRTSQSRKPESFFKELEELDECESMVDSYPLEWSKAVRPIIAKCKPSPLSAVAD